jgi:hypothetical protein
MSGLALQLSFTLRTSPNVRTVHLIGSWDNYKSQLPLSVLKEHDAKPGSWKGTFRFHGGHALKLGTRYWYYFIVDGYHVSHDPAKEYTTEPTTGRKPNILDIPGGKSGSSGNDGSRHDTTASQNTSRHSRETLTDRALSPGKIQHPKPRKPYESRHLCEADYSTSRTDDDNLADRFAGTGISDRDYMHSSSPSRVSTSLSCSTTFNDSDSRSSPSYLSSSSESSSENSEESSESEEERRSSLKRRSYVQEKPSAAGRHSGGQKVV